VKSTFSTILIQEKVHTTQPLGCVVKGQEEKVYKLKNIEI